MKLKIKNWRGSLLEVSKTARVERKSYATFPAKRGGGKAYLQARKDGRAVYGCFIELCMICHLQPAAVRDGWLTDDGTPEGRPLDVLDFVTFAGGTEAEWKNAIEVLSDPKHRVQWLEVHEVEGQAELPLVDDKPIAAKAEGPSKAEIAKQAEELYKLYPRKAKPDNAKAAIEKRLRQGVPFDHLRDRVEAFAECVSRWPSDKVPRMVPYPATWFNAGQYNDDPASWEMEGSAQPLTLKQEGFSSAPERASMLKAWAEALAGDRTREACDARIEKAGAKFGPRFVEDMKTLASKIKNSRK